MFKKNPFIFAALQFRTFFSDALNILNCSAKQWYSAQQFLVLYISSLYEAREIVKMVL